MTTRPRDGELVPTAAELHAELARQRILRYHIAPMVGVHPGILGQMLRGSVPLPDEVALRVVEALEKIKEQRR